MQLEALKTIDETLTLKRSSHSPKYLMEKTPPTWSLLSAPFPLVFLCRGAASQ